MAEYLKPSSDRPSYPFTPKIWTREAVHDDILSDAYTWMEQPSSVLNQWIVDQNTFTQEAIQGVSEYTRIEKAMAAVQQIGELQCPEVYGTTIFQWRRSGNEQFAVLYKKDIQGEKEEIALDPHQIEAQGFGSVLWSFVSPDGKYIAYGTGFGGDEETTLRIRDVETGIDLMDSIPNTGSASLAWTVDGFYITRHSQVGTETDKRTKRDIYFHRLGTNTEEDILIYDNPQPGEIWPDFERSHDGSTLMMYLFHSFSQNDLFVADLLSTPRQHMFRPVMEGQPFRCKGNVVGDDLYIITDALSEKDTIYRVNRYSPDISDTDTWKVVFSPDDETIIHPKMWGTFSQEKMVVNLLTNASARLATIDLHSSETHVISLSPLSQVREIKGQFDTPELFYLMESFNIPQTVYRMNIDHPDQAIVDSRLPVDVDPSVIAEQSFAISADGTRIPVSIIRSAGSAIEGSQPAIVYGYGGFGEGIFPYYSPRMMKWVAEGNVYAVAHIRGGSELGRDWHRQAMKTNKQRTIDDFIAAAELLISRGNTTPDTLAAWGGSNGGLTVLASAIQRPDLFGAVIAQTPVADTVTIQKSPGGSYWISEYGDAAKPEELRTLLDISPYFNVQDGVEYPAMLLITGENDSRVSPWQSYKMAARLQAATSSTDPILLSVLREQGHGVVGVSSQQQIDQYTQIFTFLAGTIRRKY